MYALGSEGLIGLTQQEVWIVPAGPAAQDFRLWADLPAILMVTGVAVAPPHNPPTPRAQPHIGKTASSHVLFTLGSKIFPGILQQTSPWLQLDHMIASPSKEAGESRRLGSQGAESWTKG